MSTEQYEALRALATAYLHSLAWGTEHYQELFEDERETFAELVRTGELFAAVEDAKRWVLRTGLDVPDLWLHPLGTIADDTPLPEHRRDELGAIIDQMNIRLTRLDANAQPAAMATDPERRDDNGFVANPTDEAAYVPLTKILSEHTPPHVADDAKGLTRYLDAHKGDVRQWRPRPNRRSVHLGDWLRSIAPKPKGGGDTWADDTAGIVERTKAIRARKAAGG